MTIAKQIIDNLRQLRQVIDNLSQDQFSTPIAALSQSTIGAHVRHVLEFYQCIQSANSGPVCYDSRARNALLENDRSAALLAIDAITDWLGSEMNDAPLAVKADFSTTGGSDHLFASSFFRELAFCFEHGIHHQAMIKVALKEFPDPAPINEDFGVAPSTSRAFMRLEVSH